MIKPKAIIFDYGHTLIYETRFDPNEAGKALFDVISENRYGIQKEVFAQEVERLYNDLSKARRQLSLEIPASTLFCVIQDYYNIKFSLNEIELEEYFWNYLSPPVAMDGVKGLLEYLYQEEIKTAVISNLWYKNDVLRNRLNKLIPNNHFDCIISTCEYGFRKPYRIIFDIALRKMGLQADEAWFCGDEPVADIEGAHSAGIKPIWIDSDIICPYKFNKQTLPSVSCIKIKELRELIELVKNCK